MCTVRIFFKHPPASLCLVIEVFVFLLRGTRVPNHQRHQRHERVLERGAQPAHVVHHAFNLPLQLHAASLRAPVHLHHPRPSRHLDRPGVFRKVLPGWLELTVLLERLLSISKQCWVPHPSRVSSDMNVINTKWLCEFIHHDGWFFSQNHAIRVQESLAKSNSVATETFSSIKTVKSFANEDGESKRYRKCLEHTYSLNKVEAAGYAVSTWTNSVRVTVCFSFWVYFIFAFPFLFLLYFLFFYSEQSVHL